MMFDIEWKKKKDKPKKRFGWCCTLRVTTTPTKTNLFMHFRQSKNHSCFVREFFLEVSFQAATRMAIGHGKKKKKKTFSCVVFSEINLQNDHFFELFSGKTMTPFRISHVTSTK
eukprot:Lithocolla_globosa_v1_NODE_22_length_9343_cov_54.984819.p10 type:complete len:114 gc:universal NODE_22_length_9343_cov_54.984819:2686-3027(+)